MVARRNLEGLASLLKEALILANPGGDDAVDPASDIERMRAALDDDLNTPEAVEVLRWFIRPPGSSAAGNSEIAEAQVELRTLARLFGRHGLWWWSEFCSL
ncbi:MAG: DALR domain-containing protein [Thermomicrobiales bacterium]